MTNDPTDALSPNSGNEVTAIDAGVQAKLRHPLRRIGCIILLILWFVVLLTPCLLLTLATQGEIRVSTGGAPGQEVRVWVVMEAETRGLGVSTGTISSQTPTDICVETNINYLLWSGREAPITYCDCYERPNDSVSWTLNGTTTGTCQG